MTLPAPDHSAVSTSRRARITAKWRAWTEPRPDGLPNRKVMGIPLAFVGVLFLLLVGFGVTGSSTGIIHSQISDQADENLIAGQPQSIRSDEWFVQTSWVISQVEQSLPAWNESFPGGMDATVQNDLPNADWSTAFRPHLWGFFVLPLDQAMAVKWWLPALGVIAAVYLFAVTLLPRRPLVSMAIAVAMFFAPFLQWWYLTLTLYPVIWAFTVMAAFVWCLRSRTRLGAWLWGAAAAYVTPALAMGIYVPFIVPAVVVTAAFCLGALLSRDIGRSSVMQRVKDVLPVIVGGVVGGGVMVVWLVTRFDTIEAFLGTVYPGERLQSVGGADLNQFAQLLGGFLSFGLERTQGSPFTVNASEASTFLLPGLFLLVMLVWLAVRAFRAERRWQGMSIGLVVAALVMLAFLFVPGWDALAHALLLDRTTYSRMRMGFGILSTAVLVVLIFRIDQRRAVDPGWRPARTASFVSTGLALGSIALVISEGARILGLETWLQASARRDVVAAVAAAIGVVVVVWLFSRGRPGPAAAVLLVVTLALTVGVNPLYRGVLDLRQTNAVTAVQEADAEDPGAWVGINASLLPTMMLVESGVTTYNGVQGAPSDEMWKAIDPSGAEEQRWDRLATVSWLPGEGAPAPRNPAPDQIQMTFDSCASFAQENVTWVLSPVALDQRCVTETESVVDGPTQMRIYRVVPAS